MNKSELVVPKTPRPCLRIGTCSWKGLIYDGRNYGIALPVSKILDWISDPA
jgi:hypothetical protein